MEWLQNYNPLGNAWLSTLVAALPVVILLALIAILEVRIHIAALIGLGAALRCGRFGGGLRISLLCRCHLMPPQSLILGKKAFVESIAQSRWWGVYCSPKHTPVQSVYAATFAACACWTMSAICPR